MPLLVLIPLLGIQPKLAMDLWQPQVSALAVKPVIIPASIPVPVSSSLVISGTTPVIMPSATTVSH